MRPFLFAMSALMVAAESSQDAAVVAALRHADAGMAHVRILQRSAVTGELDLVIAIGSPGNWALEPDRLVPWTDQQKLGLFLQDKNPPGRVYPLTVETGSGSCVIRVERITSAESVVACTGDDVQSTPMNHKFVYDWREKKLAGRFSYSPFRMYRVFADAGGAVFVGGDSQRVIAISYQPGSGQPFRVLNEAEARPWVARLRTSEGTVGEERKRILYVEPEEFHPVHFGAFKLDQENGNSFGPRLAVMDHQTRYELPQSSYDAFAAARPARVKNNYVRANTEFDERIGPYQVADAKLWFGKTFYDGEGTTGVGGFGYFDPADRKYHLFAPSEIADWSVTAILVEPDTVWTALALRGEYGGPSGGVLRFDRRSEEILKLAMPDFGEQFLRVGNDLLVATSGGMAVIHDGQVTRYFVDRDADGGLHVVPSFAHEK